MDSRPGDGIRKRVQPFAEQFAEATTACLLAMVQGNPFALTGAHWLVASRTGALAALATSAALALARNERRATVALLLGLGTTAADAVVHAGRFGPFLFESVVTGIAASALSLTFGRLIDRLTPPPPTD
ncbi:MAG: hypothetical protein U0900_04665 [Myxococcota bacterium]